MERGDGQDEKQPLRVSDKQSSEEPSCFPLLIQYTVGKRRAIVDCFGDIENGQGFRVLRTNFVPCKERPT